jgi:hypothetical protein
MDIPKSYAEEYVLGVSIFRLALRFLRQWVVTDQSIRYAILGTFLRAGSQFPESRASGSNSRERKVELPMYPGFGRSRITRITGQGGVQRVQIRPQMRGWRALPVEDLLGKSNDPARHGLFASPLTEI